MGPGPGLEGTPEGGRKNPILSGGGENSGHEKINLLVYSAGHETRLGTVRGGGTEQKNIGPLGAEKT